MIDTDSEREKEIEEKVKAFFLKDTTISDSSPFNGRKYHSLREGSVVRSKYRSFFIIIAIVVVLVGLIIWFSQPASQTIYASAQSMRRTANTAPKVIVQ